MKAIILAAGLGSRMRRDDDQARLSADQAAAAATGIKALIPIGRPFLDYVLHGLADAGFSDICLVIGPHHDQIRDYYGKLALRRIRIEFAVQPEPLGTANALAAAADCIGSDCCVVLNSDNYYPAEALAALRRSDREALVGFERDALIRHGNIAAERIAQFAVVESDAEGYLHRIVEKPRPEQLAALPAPALVSMNCWRFSAAIFEACRSIEKSARDEYELPAAVTYSMERLQCRYRVIQCGRPVLDLSCRRDVAAVARALRNVEVNL